MYIRSNVRGTNQYGGKGRLMDATWCPNPNCRRLNSTAEYGENEAGFPIKRKITNCHTCGADLFPDSLA